MNTLEKLQAKLPSVIIQNQVLLDVLGGVGSGIDDYLNLGLRMEINLKVNSAEGSALDSLAADVGLSRSYNEADISLRIRIQNAVETAQRRGSQIGVEREGAENLLVTPFLQKIQFAIGVDPIAAGSAISGRYAWTQVWNDGSLSQIEATTFIKSLFPIHNTIGVDYIAGQLHKGSMDNHLEGESVQYLLNDDGDILYNDDGLILYTEKDEAYIDADGFHLAEERVLIPHVSTASVIWGDITLPGGFTNYTWMIDWLSFKRWDVVCDEKVYVQFSSDQLNWSEWIEYNKNGLVPDAVLKKYTKFKLELTLTDYEDFEHYAFSRFIIKSLDATQLQYGGHPISIELQQEFLK